MLIEQLVTAHSRIGDLQAEAACAATPESATAYTMAAAKLMAEFRRSSLGLREYRSPVSPKRLTVVTGNEQVAVFEGEASSQPAAEKTSDSELGTTQRRLNHVDLASPFPTTDRSTPEPVEAKRLNPRRPAAAETGGNRKSTMETLERVHERPRVRLGPRPMAACGKTLNCQSGSCVLWWSMRPGWRSRWPNCDGLSQQPNDTSPSQQPLETRGCLVAVRRRYPPW